MTRAEQWSPPALAVHEAIEHDIAEGLSPYPYRFGRAVVLCFADGTRRILEIRTPGDVTA